jgi:Na+/serine symporter
MKDFENQNAPAVSVGDWMVTILIAAIPVVNIIMLIVWAFSNTTNPSKTNWAKATLIWMLIGIGLSILFWVIFGFAFMTNLDEFN